MYGKKGADHPGWKGGITIDGNGYEMIYSPNHPYKNKTGYVRSHRLVLEQYYTILLGYNVFLDPKIYHVHHIDGNIKNNNYWNLQLVTGSQHVTIHNLIDMSDRFCILCKSNKTYIMKHNNRPHWMKYEEGYACANCYAGEYRKKMKIEVYIK